MAGRVSHSRGRLAINYRAISAGFDYSAAAYLVPDTCYRAAIDQSSVRPCCHSAFAVDRTVVAMTDEHDRFHLRFLLSKLSAGTSNTSAGGGAALTLNKRQIMYQLIATERL